MQNQIEKIIIITHGGFPNGMASTNRIISHAKGFLHNNIKTSVLLLNKTERKGQIQNQLSNGVFEGIPYRYLYATNLRSKWLIKRGLDYYFKNILLFLFVLKNCNQRTAILYYCPETIAAIAIKLASLFSKTIIIKEETEFPSVRVLAASFLKKYLFLKFHYYLFDGLLVITKQLVNYFIYKVKFTKPVIHIPMVVDVDRFSANEPTGKDVLTNLVFTGEIHDDKEGIKSLLIAFSKAANIHDDLRLNIYGKIKEEKKEEYLRYINSLGALNKINFHGYKNRYQITEILSKADVLVFSRPRSIQATYGFSTKLGEYLASGNPVIATNIGEIPHYLQDRVSAFICEPDEEQFFEKILEVKSDPIFAKKVGDEGRKVALKCFNNKNESKRIIEFIEGIAAKGNSR